MIVMKYAKDGSLRKNLQNIAKVKWIIKLVKLQEIISGLSTIHQQKLVHCDFHHGNILDQQYSLSISDLGLCKPVQYYRSLSIRNEIYGVLPFMAPEILRGKPYTTASDVYSFSMIMWEFTSGIPPFDDRAHDFQLALSISKGERPETFENTPQCYIDLMEKCWDVDPLKRPPASEVIEIVRDWLTGILDYDDDNVNLENDIMEFIKADDLAQELTNITKSHPQAYRASRLLDFTEKLNEILEENDQIDGLHKKGVQDIGNY